MNVNVPLANSACNEVLEWKKRSSVYSNDLEDGNLMKRARIQNYYVLESESSASSDERTESIYSIQDRETDFVADTSDTDTKSIDSDNYDVQIEFEIASSSSNEDVLEQDLSSDGNDALLVAGVVAASIIEESEFWATDGDDTDVHNQSPCDTNRLSETQMCCVCKIRETFSCFTICSHCYQIRKNMYPPRPRRPRHKKLKSNLSCTTTVTADKLQSCLSGLSQDSGLCSSQDKLPLDWENVVVPENLLQKCEGSGKSPEADKNCSAKQGNNSAAGTSALDDKVEGWSKAAQELCIICQVMPKDGIFVHSTGGHLCCCYKCAIKFFGKSRRCAACNCRVLNVIKAYII